MRFFYVKFQNGREVRVNSARDEQEALRKAFMEVTAPVYCRIHAEIAANSNAPVGEMGLYFPPSDYPVSAREMKYVYMGAGHCLIPA